MKNKFLTQKNKGFALLFSVIVSIVLLAIASSIISVSLKQIIFSGTGRESQLAFYSANTGIECALFWNFTRANNNAGGDLGGEEDNEDQTLDTIFSINGDSLVNSGDNITCAKNDIIGTVSNGWSITSLAPSADSYFSISGGPLIQTRFWIYYPDQDGDVPNNSEERKRYPCTDVRVKRQLNENNNELKTKIEARGYNTCDLENRRTVERGLEVLL
jgi:hypothetical protein